MVSALKQIAVFLPAALHVFAVPDVQATILLIANGVYPTAHFGGFFQNWGEFWTEEAKAEGHTTH